MRAFPTSLVLSLALPFGFTTSLTSTFAADWPSFRGADRQDISRESGLLKEWPENGPKQVWLNQDVGLGYSGYAIVGDSLYTLGARDAVEYVIAVDVATGKEKWSAEAGALLTNNWGNGPRSTPTVDGDHVYAMGGKGTLVCLTKSDGKEVWRVTMESLGGQLPGWGFCESPLVEGNLVIVTPGGPQGTLAAFDKLTGTPAWRSATWTDPAQYSSIVPVDHHGTRQLIQLTMQSVAGVNAANGELLWKNEFPGKTAVIPTPIFSEGQVFVTAGYGVGCKSFKIGADNSIEELYQTLEMGNHHGGVVLVNGHLYGFAEKNGWTCMDFKTGEVKWVEKRTLGKGAIHAADGMLYLLEEKTGTVVLITATPEGWQEHGRFTLQPQTTQRNPKGMIWTHPVVSGGRLYLRDQELLFSFDVSGK
ncbi:Outer membrane protein assembly factor BamB, contains PQQ-like beta-propeller repeat [Prosthecobacter debontii]|uniref:Outer membrane protein assembly factor BamB, contains PQQ-like beta-propeller repeat n=1 Tax=Prosthecobacter debontii TaxID=48467 RepID=A0A1T4XXT9_9BACT|nr:PQQ-binding-like beta-propeller repeat protein [Prosthecobacter debontii]SKA94392.1 Outer membrane protein assembly factor BamB, contains PQQ-like beta-propeller repeat [Prosthecobacter debontii]